MALCMSVLRSDLIKRVWQHKNDLAVGFSSRYDAHTLIWYERHETMESAILREKLLKGWKRAWKIRLIENENPEWLDLYSTLLQLDCEYPERANRATPSFRRRPESSKTCVRSTRIRVLGAAHWFI
jgi:putative endonuclease